MGRLRYDGCPRRTPLKNSAETNKKNLSLAATKFVHVGLFLRKKMVAFLFQPAAELLDRVPKRLVIADFDLSFLFAYLLHLVNILRERAAKNSFITQDRNEHFEATLFRGHSSLT